MGVVSVGVGSREARMALEVMQGKEPLSPRKKGEKPPKELNYHNDFVIFTKLVDIINEKANIKSTNGSFDDALKLVSQTLSASPTTFKAE